MFTNDSPDRERLGRLRSVRVSYSVSELSRATGSEAAPLWVQARLLRLILKGVADTITNRVYRQRRSNEGAGPRIEFSMRCKSALDDRAGRRPANLTLPFPRIADRSSDPCPVWI